MTDSPLELVPLNLSYRSYLSCFGLGLFLAVNVFVLTLEPPLWMRFYAWAMVLFIGASLLSFARFGRKWTRTSTELIVPILRIPERRLAIPAEGIGIQKLPLGRLMIYLGDPWERSTPRIAPNMCMSSADIQEWLPHHKVPTSRRPKTTRR